METEKQFNQAFKEIAYIFIGLCIGLGMALFAQQCDGTNPAQTKAVKGIIKPKNKVVNVPVPYEVVKIKDKTIYRTKTIYKENDSLVGVLLVQNEAMKAEFAKLNDSLHWVKYAQAIEINEFTKELEDEKIKIKAYGVARGQVQSIGIDYTIKPQPIPSRNHLYLGFSVGNTYQFNNALFTGSLGYQQKKGNIIELGFDSEKRIVLGYKIKLF